MDQLFNVNGRFLPFEQASKIMAEKRGEIAKEEVVEEPKKIEEIVETKSAFVCLECGRECKSQWHLDKHLKSHNKVPVDSTLNPQEGVNNSTAVVETGEEFTEEKKEIAEMKEDFSNLNKILE